MKRAVFDIETNGLLDELTRVHSLVLRDLDNPREVVSCTDDDPNRPGIEHGLTMLAAAERLYGHNVIGFDLPAIQKVYPRFSYEERRIRDTLITGRFWKQNIADTDWSLVKRKTLPASLVGSHSLEAWGYRLNVLKGTYGKDTDWQEWTPQMQTYCERDTVVTWKLVKLLATKKLSAPALATEHELAFFLADMERNGFPLNVEQCERLYATLAARRSLLDVELREVFQPWVVEVGPFTPRRNDRTKGYVKGCPATKIKIVEFKPSSREHIVGRLQKLYGWAPTEFTDNGNPKMDDEVMSVLPYPEAPKLAEYLLVAKRIGQLAEGPQAWLKIAKPNALTGLTHVHGSINQLGAVTHRATHSKPNMSQVPKVRAAKDGSLIWGKAGDYSTDFRNVWHVPAGWKQLGADASGLELRCLAHFMAEYDDGAYGKAILLGKNEDGTDIHSVNRDALGLEGKAGREIAKTFIYAYLYGAGDAKLGSILEPLSPLARQKQLGGQLRARFERNLPALTRLVEATKEEAKAGYLTVLDGRHLRVRSEHSALNTKLQGAGAIICKTWLARTKRKLTERFGPQGWAHQWAALMWPHDELQAAFRPNIVDEAAVIVVDSIRHMTTHFAFRCPLDGEAKIGSTWAECH